MSEEKEEAINSWLETALHFSPRFLAGKCHIQKIKHSLNSHLYPFIILQEAKHLSYLS